MALTGLISELLNQISQDWELYQRLEASKERQARDKSLAITLALLKRVAATKDINLILATEKLLISQELSLYANSPEEHNSIKAALSQLEDAERALLIVRNFEAYQNATSTYPAKRKENGLPLDSFREFIKSHSTRLTNRLAGHLAMPEKELLRQRKASLQQAKLLYIALQIHTLSEQN
jgi:serine phosphatase RsbU (regulator of sigma subunit)